MARLCESGPEPAHQAHDGPAAGVAGLSSTNGGSGTVPSEYTETVEVEGVMASATVVGGTVTATACSCGAAEEDPDDAGSNGALVAGGNGRVAVRGEGGDSKGTSCGGDGAISSADGVLKAVAATAAATVGGSEVSVGEAPVPATTPAAMAASSSLAAVAAAAAVEDAGASYAASAHVAGVVAIGVEELSPSFPATAPTAPAPAVAVAVAGGGAAAPTGRGVRSRRRRKNAAKSAAAAAAAAAAAEANAADKSDDDIDTDDDKEADVAVANGQAEDVCEEDDEGNVEYKLKLVNPPLARLEHLFTQMNWRLNEGRGECMYMLGYEDDGKATGMSPSELRASIKTLRVMMEAVGAKIADMQVQAGAGGKRLKVARVTVVRQATLFDGLPPDSERRGLRVGVLGHAGAGKSTLVSVLTRGLSDNGRGLARMQVFRHNHEVFNGQTSSISQQALTLPLAYRDTGMPLGKTAPAALGAGCFSNAGGVQRQAGTTVAVNGKRGDADRARGSGGGGGTAAAFEADGGSANGNSYGTRGKHEAGTGAGAGAGVGVGVGAGDFGVEVCRQKDSGDDGNGNGNGNGNGVHVKSGKAKKGKANGDPDGDAAASATAAAADALALSSSSSSPSTRMLSSSFPRSSRLEGALASNGFASAWARRDNGNSGRGVGGAGSGRSGGVGRRRGESLDESGGRRGLRRRFDGQEDDDGGESRVLTFIDQPGHEKYLKTTLTGMTASALDYSMLVVSGVEGVQRMTREHLAIALALKLPTFVVMTKSDVAGSLPPGTSSSLSPPPAPQATSPPGPPSSSSSSQEHRDRFSKNEATAVSSSLPPAPDASAEMRAALQGLIRVLFSCLGRRAKIVGGVEDAEDAASALRGGSSGAAGASSWGGLVPVLQVSSVTSDGFAELRAFLGRLAPPEPLEAMYKEARGKAAEVRISNTFMVEGVGEVYAGNVVSGTVSVGDRLLLGPTGPSGAFIRTAVASVHVARVAVRRASAGQTASFTLVADPDSEEEEEEDDDDDDDRRSVSGNGSRNGSGLMVAHQDQAGVSTMTNGLAVAVTVAVTVAGAPEGSGAIAETTASGAPVHILPNRDDGDDDRDAVTDSTFAAAAAAAAAGVTATTGAVGTTVNTPAVATAVPGACAGYTLVSPPPPPAPVVKNDGEQRSSGERIVGGKVSPPARDGGGGSGGVGVAPGGGGGGAPLFDGGGFAGGGGGGDGESPSRRTRKKGMVLVEATGRPNTSYEFEAEVMILHHPGVIRANYQPVVHAHNICQSARITSMVLSEAAADVGVPATTASGAPAKAAKSATAAPAAPAPGTAAGSTAAAPGPGGSTAAGKSSTVSAGLPAVEGPALSTPATGIKSGERAVCRFRFLYRPEYLSVGTTIVLREGRTRGFGKVISVSVSAAD